MIMCLAANNCTCISWNVCQKNEHTWFEICFLLLRNLNLNLIFALYSEVKQFLWGIPIIWIRYYNFILTLCLLNTIVCYSDGFGISKSFTRQYSTGIVWSWRLQMPMRIKGKSSTFIVYAARGSAPCFCGLVGLFFPSSLLISET